MFHRSFNTIFVILLGTIGSAHCTQQQGIEWASATLNVLPGGKMSIMATPGFNNLFVAYLMYNLFKQSVIKCVAECRANGVDPYQYFDDGLDMAFWDCVQDCIDEGFGLDLSEPGDKDFELVGEDKIILEKDKAVCNAPMYDNTVTCGSGFTINQELSVSD